MSVGRGFIRRNGHARCGGCELTVYRIGGGKRARKAEGWRHTIDIGWVCRLCALWAAPGAIGRTDRSVVEKTTPNVDNSRRFGPTPTLDRARFLDLVPSLTGRQARAMRRRAKQKSKKAEDRTPGDRAYWSSSKWRRWKKSQRAKERKQPGR